MIEEKLVEAAKLFNERSKQYGEAYKRSGKLYLALFPNGVTLKTEEDFTRFVRFTMCTMKLNRYAQNLEKGGHADSAKDLIVYAAMLEEITNEQD